MAKAVAKCICRTCGKEFEFAKILRNCTEAENFKSWAEENIIECEKCRKDRVYLSHKQENISAMESANKNGWPELTGTPKQIEWANSIREKEVSPIVKLIDENEQHKNIEHYRCAIKSILSHTRSDWWIFNRGSISYLFKAEIRKLTAEDIK